MTSCSYYEKCIKTAVTYFAPRVAHAWGTPNLGRFMTHENSKDDLENRAKYSFKKRNFRIAFAPQEILANPNRPSWLFSAPEKTNLVFLDFETTGGNPSNSSIIEIGAIKYSHGKEIGRFETLIKPRHHISGIVQKITGISNKMVDNSPTFEEIAHKFFEFIGDSVIVAHGALGDIAFVYQHYKEIMNTDFTNYYFCTHLLVSHFLPNIPSKTLSGIAKYFNLPDIPAHKANNDAQLTCDVFWRLTKIFEKHGFENCIDLLKIQADNETLKKLGPGINPNLSESIPTTSGVVFLTNPDQEISFVTASQNIRKTYNKLTTISLDRELNKIIAHVEGFKYERANNFLDALLKENRQLKKISLGIDPRKLQNRSENFIQIFIPEDMLEFANSNSNQIPIQLPAAPTYNFIHDSEEYIPKDMSHEPNNFLLNFNKSDEKIPIVKTRKNFTSPQSKKFMLSRLRSNPSSIVESGHLKEGIGYFFGPFEKPKEVESWLNEIMNDLPIHNNLLPMRERFLYLRILISYLNNSIQNEVANTKNSFLNLNSLKELFFWPLTRSCFKKSKKLLDTPLIISKNQHVKSGLGVISNNELKELEVIVVIRGIITKKVRLPIEQTDKLKSSRYFTRLFEKSYEQIKSFHTPIIFTEDSCADIELFSYWLENKRGEGEWIDFFELEPLYDASIL